MKKNVTLSIDIEVIERVKNAVYWMPGHTMSSLVSRAIDTYISDLESVDGKFNIRRHEPTKGRRPN